MNRLFVLAVLLLLAGCASTQGASRPGVAVLLEAFDPARNFAGDLRPSSDDELVLSVRASARDDYAPEYSLAIAYRCTPSDTEGQWRCGYAARLLRVGLNNEDGSFGRSLELFGQAGRAASAADMRARLDRASLQWLEADVNACPNGVFAMDSVRVADWRPDIHYALQRPEEREIILHPAAIRVRMHGSYSTATYEGWVLAAGVPEAVRHLLETLEPCWHPADSAKPWRRVAESH